MNNYKLSGSDKQQAIVTGILVVVGILLVFGFAAAQPYFEARAFNNCTGSHATYWDAVFSQLRIQECKK